MISIIAAIAKNRAIGKDNQLLCHISEDLKRFKRLTSGHKVIMGSNTLLSLPRHPLPNRTNIVITKQKDKNFDGCLMVHSIAEAAALCSAEEECFVMGGASIYQQFMPLAEKLYITKMDKDFDGDTFFPTIDPEVWKLTEESEPVKMDDGSFSYRFQTWQRR
jgi:dihydrofolate reductase